MARGRFNVLAFRDDHPVWYRCDNGSVLETAAPAPGERTPLLALLPDGFFQFHRQAVAGIKGGRRLASAVDLALRGQFPPVEAGQGSGLAAPAPGLVLGYFSAPGLDGFLAGQRALLDRASAVSTGFLAACRAAALTGLSGWSYAGGPARALALGEELAYFRGDAVELAGRAARAGLPEPPETLPLERILSILSGHGADLRGLSLPLPALRAASAGTGRRGLVTALILTAGLLFCAGQALRLGGALRQDRFWRESIQARYVSSLGADIGADPYGRLLALRDRLKSAGGSGPGPLEALAEVSRQAPPGLEIEGVSLGGDSGSLRGSAPDFASLEAFTRKLADSENFSFTLQQSNTLDSGRVAFTLKIAPAR